MSEPITVWQLFSDGSHAHRDGKRCWENHNKKKVDYKMIFAGLIAWACFTLAITLIAHLILKANGL